MSRMRTLSSAYNYLKQTDPDCCIGKQWLYQQVRSGALPHINAGKRIIIDLDALEQFLKNPPIQKPIEDHQAFGIRRVATS